EHVGEPLMSQDFLAQVIRSYGGAMQSFVGSYLEQSLKLLASQQQQVREQMRGVMGSDTYDAVATLTQRNFERWRAVQDEIFKAMTSGAPATGARAKEREGDSPEARGS